MNINPLIHKGRKSKPYFLWFAFSIFFLFIVGGDVGLRYGAISYSHQEVWQTLFHPFSNTHIQNIIIDIRLPRLIASLLVGAAMAVAGAMMQGITRNPIADPGLLGINAGAGLALVIASTFSKGLHYTSILLVCLLGSTIATLLVFGIAFQPKKGIHQLRLILAGSMIATFCSSIGQGFTIYFKLSGAIIGWQAGGLVGVNWTMLAYIAPIILIGLLLAQLLSHQLTVFSLNETLAKGLGQRTLPMTIAFLTIVLLLSATSVALVGSLAFVGLIIPHLVRLFLPQNYKLLLPFSAATGATFMLWVDIVCRTFHPPYETPLNAIISLVGLPCFILLIRRRTEL